MCKFIIYATLLPLALSLQYNITYLNSHSGLFFNHLGNALLATSKFTLFANVDISHLYQLTDNLEALLFTSRHLCTHHGVSDSPGNIAYYCRNSLESISFQLEDIRSKENTIKHLTGENKRPARGLFDGVSHGLKWLFGIPSADDAKFYDESIRAILDSNRNLELLMKKQIAVVSGCMIDFNRTMESFRVNEEKLLENLIRLSAFENQTAAYVRDLDLRQTISEHMTLLFQMATIINENLDTVISAITLGKRNILHPRVITPVHLVAELNKVLVKDDFKFPLPLTISNIFRYYDLATLDVLYADGVLLFAVKIPLVQTLDFSLFQILPLPVPHNSSHLYSYIHPSTPYLVISITKSLYQGLDSLDHCTKLDEPSYICHGVELLHTSHQQSCETTLLTTVTTKIPASCQVRTISADMEVWHPLGNNRWIFALTQPTLVTLRCGNTLQDIELSTTGVLQIDGSCRCYTRNSVLQGSVTVSGNYYSRVPDYNLALDECCRGETAKANLTPSHLEPIKVNSGDLNQLRHISWELQELGKEVDKQLSVKLQQGSSLWHSHWVSVIGSVVGVVGLYLICRGCGISQGFGCFGSGFSCNCFQRPPQGGGERRGEAIPGVNPQ